MTQKLGMNKDEMDEQSRPLRKAVHKWFDTYKGGMSSGYYYESREWRYVISAIGFHEFTVVVDEAGTQATIEGTKLRAFTPAGLKRIMNKAAKL